MDSKAHHGLSVYMLTTTVFQNCEFMSNELFPSDEFSSVYWVKKH